MLEEMANFDDNVLSFRHGGDELYLIAFYRCSKPQRNDGFAVEQICVFVVPPLPHVKDGISQISIVIMWFNHCSSYLDDISGFNL